MTTPADEHPMDRALRHGAIPVPKEIATEIGEATNSGLPTRWPEYVDRDGEIWQLTSEVHDGDAVMLPCAGDMDLMLHRDVDRLFGPLTAIPALAAARALTGDTR